MAAGAPGQRKLAGNTDRLMSDFSRARKLYRSFREAEPKKVRKLSVPALPRAVMPLGYLDFVGYTTTHRGIETPYKHTFSKRARPLLCTDGKRLFILQGRYRVTSRGIVDLDESGREQN